MKRRTERRKREREQLPDILLVLHRLIPPNSDPRHHLETSFGMHACSSPHERPPEQDLDERHPNDEDVHDGEKEDGIIQGKGLKRLLTALNSCWKQHFSQQEDSSPRKDGPRTENSATTTFTSTDLLQITKRVPRSRSTPERIDIAELCFALHQASCPVEVHTRRQYGVPGGAAMPAGDDRDAKSGEGGGRLRTATGVLDTTCPLIRYYAGKRFADLMSGTSLDDAGLQSEWDAFFRSLTTPLPMTLRLHHNEKTLEWIGRQFLERHSAVTAVIQPALPGPTNPLALYGCSHADYHTHPTAEYICRTLHSANAVSFQEVVSALPVLVLDAQPQHRVLDMCAAPGSKTLHALDEMLRGGQSAAVSQGVLIASEKDRVKATQTLPARLKRYHAPNALCVRCDGTQWPRLYTCPPLPSNSSTCGEAPGWSECLFDRILCDVPCSGDGTARKEPSIPTTWSAGYVESLVPTQTALLRRGIDLLAVNGILVYSTCSLNPKEDEEVLCAVLDLLSGEEVELLDVNAILQTKGVQLRSTCGIQNLEAIAPLRELPHAESAEASHPPRSAAFGGVAKKLYDGTKVLRVWPHRDDTGGFFVAALRKRKLADLTPPASVERKLNQWTKGKLWSPIPEQEEEWQNILDFYGLREATCFAYLEPVWSGSGNDGSTKPTSWWTLKQPNGIAKDTVEPPQSGGMQLVPVFQHNPNGGPPRRIALVTIGLAQMLFCTKPYKGPGVEVVSAGARAFEKYDPKFLPTAACRWRATVEALSFLAPHCRARGRPPSLHSLTRVPAGVGPREVRLTASPNCGCSQRGLLESLLQSGFVSLVEHWPAVLLARSTSETRVREGLVEPGSRLEALLHRVAAGSCGVEEATREMEDGTRHRMTSASSADAAQGNGDAAGSFFALDDVRVGGVMLCVEPCSAPSCKVSSGAPLFDAFETKTAPGHEAVRAPRVWHLSATLSRSKLEVAVDGSLRAFGLLTYCGVQTSMNAG